MDKLPKEILAEIEYVEISLANLKTTLMKSEKSVIELSAIATFIHNIYNGVENILKQIFKKQQINLTKSEFWHKELIQTAVSHKIISSSLSNKLYEYLSFRHFFIHGYGFMLEEEQLSDLANDAPEVWQQLLKEIKFYFENKSGDIS